MLKINYIAKQRTNQTKRDEMEICQEFNEHFINIVTELAENVVGYRKVTKHHRQMEKETHFLYPCILLRL